jgi:hypothetical protein
MPGLRKETRRNGFRIRRCAAESNTRDFCSQVGQLASPDDGATHPSPVPLLVAALAADERAGLDKVAGVLRPRSCAA